MDEMAKEALLEVLAKESTPLRDFSHTMQSFGLVKQWHFFRMSLLATRLRAWSVEKAISWQQSWVNIPEPRAASVTAPATPVSVDNKRHLIELATMLTDDDLSRISIPMDIVLRLIAKK